MSNCNCRRCVKATNTQREFTVIPTPVTVTVERIDADEEMDEPDRLYLIVFRGENRIGSTDVYRGEALHLDMAREWLLSGNEHDQISALCIQEWLSWPTETATADTQPAPQLTPELLAQFDALKGALSQ
jgi:hypothetical protein